MCSANGNITEKEVDSKNCPIKHILKRQRSGKKGAKKAEDASEGDDDDDEEVVMPGQVKDKEEEQGKPPVGGEMDADVKPGA